MWDPSAGMGTVTHENIGYLWPMGPWYTVFAAVGVPTWVAQRLWTGTLLLLAGLGVRWLVRTLGWSGPGLAVATLAYMLSPYVLQYEARISAILMGFTALPWMVGLTVRGVRTGSWRHPALFALIAATAGSVNASAMVFAALGAVLWLPFAVWGLGEASVRRALDHLRQDAGPLRGGRPLVAGRPGHRERLRPQHPPLHRDGGGRLPHGAELRSAARPRQLVLLRPRRHRALGATRHGVHTVGVAAQRQLPAPGPRLRRRRRGPVALQGVLRRPDRPRRGPGGGRVPLQPPLAHRHGAEGLRHRLDAGAGAPIHGPGGAAGRPGHRHHARGRSGCAVAPPGGRRRRRPAPAAAHDTGGGRRGNGCRAGRPQHGAAMAGSVR